MREVDQTESSLSRAALLALLPKLYLPRDTFLDWACPLLPTVWCKHFGHGNRQLDRYTARRTKTSTTMMMSLWRRARIQERGNVWRWILSESAVHEDDALCWRGQAEGGDAISEGAHGGKVGAGAT